MRVIARALVEAVRKNVTIDWTLRESTRANLRRMIRRTLTGTGIRRINKSKRSAHW